MPEMADIEEGKSLKLGLFEGDEEGCAEKLLDDPDDEVEGPEDA